MSKQQSMVKSKVFDYSENSNMNKFISIKKNRGFSVFVIEFTREESIVFFGSNITTEDVIDDIKDGEEDIPFVVDNIFEV